MHAVPHLKALTSSLEPSSGHEHDSTFTHHYTLLKTTHFASETGQVAVYCEGNCMSYLFNILSSDFQVPNIFNVDRLNIELTLPPFPSKQNIDHGWPYSARYAQGIKKLKSLSQSKRADCLESAPEVGKFHT